MKQLMMTLALLLTAVTGAWAEETPLLTIESKDYKSFKSGSKTFDDKVTVTFSNGVGNDGDQDGWFYAGSPSLLTVAGTNGYTITSCKFYTGYEGIAMTGYTVKGESPSVYLSGGYVYTDASKSMSIGASGVTKIEVYGTAPSAASADEVAWDKTSKTGTFTMPGGNVTLEPEYYPQATTADGAVTAATDVAATTDAPLVTIDENKLTGATKMMYYVSTDATAPAYDAEGWTDVLPTAEKYTEAANLNVWYYPVGTDKGVGGATATYSDGDICATALAVSLGDAPLWNAEFDLTDAPEADKTGKWSTNIPEGGVKKGTEVTVTYTGTKKIIGVKAEKKSAAPASTPLDNTTTAWTAGTFAVPAGGLTYSDAITVSGDVTLVLTDGETLTLNKGISLASGATLTIEGNGTMNVNGTNNSTASTVAGTGTLVLTSGTLNAKGGNGGGYGDREAVGGSKQAGGVAINGAVTVSGGTLTATGGAGGSIGDSNADVTAGAGGAAISGSVTLSSGTLTATGGNGGNGGDHSDGTAGAGGAAIGGDLTVNGGTMTTTNGSNGSQIGMTAVNLGAGGKAVAGTVTDNR